MPFSLASSPIGVPPQQKASLEDRLQNPDLTATGRLCPLVKSDDHSTLWPFPRLFQIKRLAGLIS